MTKKEIEQQKIDRIGEKKQMNCGDIATIIYYKNFKNISVKFEDETIVENKSYYHYKKGEILNPNYKNKFIGMKNMMNCGMECEIIRFGYCDDIDAMFKDGTIIKNTTYHHFTFGEIGNPNHPTIQDKRTDLTGQKIGMLKVLNFDHKEYGKRQNRYYYKCQCECGNFILMESNYLKSCTKNNYLCSCGCGLSQSNSRLCSLKEKYPNIEKYLKNKRDSNLPILSNKIITFKCPDCGNEEDTKVSNLNKNVYICKKCGNYGVSFPERLMMEVLKTLSIDFIPQKKFQWSDNKIYDFYLPKTSTIIEVHGKQHYEKHRWKNSQKDLKSEQNNDKYKKQIALNSGIKHYITIDCRESTLNWVKKNILNSDLDTLLNLSNINWYKCFENCNRPLIKDVCAIYNKLEIKSITNVMKEMNISRRIAKECLKLGNELNLCDYIDDIKTMKYLDTNRKKVECVEIDKTFNSITECSEYMKSTYTLPISVSVISRICRGKQQSDASHRFSFKYIK